jgi:hypothetical protein
MTLGSATLSGDAVKVATISSGGIVEGSQSSAAQESIRGNRDSQICHRLDCPSYSRVSVKNRVIINSSQAAETADYRLAGNYP